jgi:hypothetical protein
MQQKGPGGLMVPQLVKHFPAFYYKCVGYRRGVIEVSDLEIWRSVIWCIFTDVELDASS